MNYFNYHATARGLILSGKLTGWYFAQRHNRISPALVLLFDDFRHPVMPVREERWPLYLPLLPPELQLPDKG